MPPTIVRKCGNLEHYSTARHNLGFYRGLANSCQYELAKEQLHGRPVREVIEEAVIRVVLRQGGLRVGITGEDTKQAYFVQVPSIDLRDFIEWRQVTAADQAQYDGQILQIIKNKLEQVWPDVATRPPWKIFVVENKSLRSDAVVLDVLFTSHHAITDGKSTLLFHRILWEELNCPSGLVSEVQNHILRFDAPPRLAPSQEDLVQFKISWPFYFRTLWDEFAPAWLKPTPPPAPWTGKPVTMEPHRLHMRLVHFEAQTVQRLLTACRGHGTTLTGLLHALVLASLARRISAHEASSFVAETAISLLPWAKLPPAEADLDLTTVFTDLNTGSGMRWDAAAVGQIRSQFNQPAGDGSAESNVLWPLAKQWRSTMSAKIATMPNDDIVGLMQYIHNYNDWALAKVGKPRSATWALSNLGAIKSVEATTGGDARGVWKINRALFSQPVNIVGPAFAMNVVGVVDGPVNAVLSWQDTVVDDAIMDGLVEDLHAWLGRFKEEGVFGMFQ